MFTVLILLLYRIGNVIPVPFINAEALGQAFTAQFSDTILGLYNALSGSAFSMATVLALSIQFVKLRFVTLAIVTMLKLLVTPFVAFVL